MHHVCDQIGNQCTDLEPRRRICKWLGQQRRSDSTRVGAPSCSDAEVSGVARQVQWFWLEESD